MLSKNIISLSPPALAKHPKMSMAERAAQFAPFSALTGHSEAMEETARETEKKIVLHEDQKDLLDAKLDEILGEIKESPLVTVTFFERDPVKTGGKYVKARGRIKEIDICGRFIIMESGTKIDVDDIYDIE